jgi:protein PhnA
MIPACTICCLDNTYPDSGNFICPDYSHEWSATTQSTEIEEGKIYKDAHGKFLIDGNTVAIIKNLKVKVSSLVIKLGSKIKNIRLLNGNHDIDCKVYGQSMLLKSEFIKKQIS